MVLKNLITSLKCRTHTNSPSSGSRWALTKSFHLCLSPKSFGNCINCNFFLAEGLQPGTTHFERGISLFKLTKNCKKKNFLFCFGNYFATGSKQNTLGAGNEYTKIFSKEPICNTFWTIIIQEWDYIQQYTLTSI